MSARITTLFFPLAVHLPPGKPPGSFNIGYHHPVIPDQLKQLFAQTFQAEPTHFASAPGRVNLIGEHTDYNDGFVFPAAIDRCVYVAARITDGRSRLVSAQLGEGASFEVSNLEPGNVEGWAAYVAGMAWVLQLESGKKVPNLEIAVLSTVPMGSGVSSSAALELAFGVLWNQIAELGYDNKKLALLGQKCENQFVGVNCGIMDQMASAMGRESKAMFLDTRTLDIEYASLPSEWAIMICDTKKPRALTDSAYNERRSQCEEAAAILGVKALRDATLESLNAAKEKMPSLVYQRAKHVVTENDRCQQFREALEKGDADSVGQLMQASHESLRDDYNVSCVELDAMAEACWEAPGCIGARMTGAGFGGACVAIISANRMEEFSVRVGKTYFERTGIQGSMLATKAVDGAHTQSAN